MPWRGVHDAGVGGDRPALLQALHADGRVDGHGELEFPGVAVIVGVDADRQGGVGTPGGLILADHQRTGFRGAQPMHVAHVIAGLIFAQTIEIEDVIDDLLGEPPFMPDQTERVALANG